MNNKSQAAVLLFAIASAVFFGLASLVLINLVGEKYYYLLSLPILFAIGLVFLVNRYLFFTLVILTRASLDVPFEAMKLGSFGLGAVLNVLVLIIAFLTFIEKREDLKHIDPSLNKAWILFLSLSTISVLYGPSFVQCLKVALLFISYFAIFSLGAMLVKSEDDFGKWIKIVVLSSVIPVLYGLFCLIFGGSGTRYSVQEGLRVQSTFTHPNALGFYTVLIISISFYLWRVRPSYLSTRIVRILPLYILLLLVILIMTKTRAAWAACYFFFFLYAAIFERKLLFWVIAAPFIALLIPDVQDRIMDLQKGNDYGSAGYGRLNSYAWRKQIWTNAIQWMDSIRYIWGYGVSSFVHYSPSFNMANAYEKMKTEINAHSAYVQLFFELGILGVLAFLNLIQTHIRALFKLYKKNKRLIFTVMVILTEFLFQSYSDNMLDYLIYEWYLWFTIGITIAFVSASNESSQPHVLSKKTSVF